MEYLASLCIFEYKEANKFCIAGESELDAWHCILISSDQSRCILDDMNVLNTTTSLDVCEHLSEEAGTAEGKI